MWAQLLSFARVHLGMGRAEFMDVTPRYFDMLVRELRQKVEREERGRDIMLAQLIAMVANTGFARFEKVRQPSEFMPRVQRSEVRAPRKPRMTKAKHAALAVQLRETFMRFVEK